MRLHTHGRRGPRRTSPALAGIAGTAVLGVALAGGVTAPPVSAAPPSGETSECPPVAAGVVDGEQLTGLTVVDGTTPEQFDAEVLGVLDNAVGPDLDLIMVRVSSPEVTQVGGIWQGMSGSPVYNANGELVGAVSYGLSYGTSPVAGLTPAAAMYDLLTEPPTTTAAALPRPAETVSVPSSVQREIVATGVATAAEAASNMSRLPLPVAVSGPVSGPRMRATLERMGMSGARVYRAGGVSATAETYPIVSGGNLAAAVSYGDYSYAALGTATAVCGSEVVAFGHPFMYTGAAGLSMHGADTLYVQEDPTWVPFKVANPGAPSGTIVQDRGVGLVAVPGAAPDGTEITSTVALGTRTRTGSTVATFPDYVPDIAAWHTYVNHERVFDAHAPGSQTMTWAVTGLREDGRTFGYTRSDRFADPYDIIWSAADQMFMDLYRLQNNGSEQVKIQDIRTTSTMSERYAKFTIRGVKVRAGGKWRTLPDHLEVRPGQTKRFRVLLESAQVPDRYVRLGVTIPKRAKGSSVISIMGGSDLSSMEDFWYEPMSGSSFDKVLASITGEPRNDQVVADVRFRRVGGGRVERSVRRQVGAIVTGGRAIGVRVMR